MTWSPAIIATVVVASYLGLLFAAFPHLENNFNQRLLKRASLLQHTKLSACSSDTIVDIFVF
jgi:hypothetical protein